MQELKSFYEFNKIGAARTFEVKALVSAMHFNTNPTKEPYWEQYDFSQIFLVREGKGTYTTETGVYPLEAGMMFYRPAYHRSYYTLEEGTTKFALVSFVCDSPAMKAFEAHPISLHEEEIVAFLDVVRTIEKIAAPIKVKSNEYKKGMQIRENVPDEVLSFIFSSLERFFSMVYCRVKNIELLVDESQKVSKYAEESKLVTEIKRYLTEHVSEKLTLNDICTHFGISQTTLMKKFRRETNQGIMEYFIERKVREARELIKEGFYNFTEIAESLGFSSLNYFSKVFKLKTGMTPTQYSKHVSKRKNLKLFN